MSAEILIVEDNASLRTIIAEILTGDGYAVHEAADGLEALEYLLPCVASTRSLGPETLPRLILLDLMMPRMNGWELRQQLLKDPMLAEVPVIIMSAQQEAQSSQEPVKAWLHKPVQYADLLKVVKRYCGERLRPEGLPAGAGHPADDLQDHPAPGR